MDPNLKADSTLCDCCGLPSCRPQIVVSRGNPFAKVMIVGEAPGAKEDSAAAPFVGKSGKLLDRLLEEVGFEVNKDFYICNAFKCRPPGNRRPTKKELNHSLPWLYKQIELVDPEIILLVGATSVEALLGPQGKITNLRGVWHDFHNRLVMPLFHPAYLLRNPSKDTGSPVSLTRSDLIKVRNKLDELM